MSNPKISVVIPIYKTGSILEKTLKSIQRQSFVDFECLMVDDGGNDNRTTEICKRFQALDDRFKFFVKENEGIEKTRIFGVRHCISNLIIFSDHDDYYEENAFEILYKNWEETNADIVVANCYSQTFHRLKYRRLHTIIERNFTISKDVLLDQYFCNFFGINIFPVSTWGKLYRKKLFEEPLRTFGHNFFEDVVLNAQLFFRASKVRFIKDRVFTHVYGGLSSRFDVHTVITAHDDIYEFRQDLLHKAHVFEKYNHFLLIEYKNIIQQYILLMIENGYSYQRFEEVIVKIKSKKLYNDMIASPLVDRGVFIEKMIHDETYEVYDFAKKSYTFKMKLKKKLKDLVRYVQ